MNRSLARLLLVALFCGQAAYADTNAQGEEIIYASPEVIDMSDSSSTAEESVEADSLPSITSEQPPSIAAGKADLLQRIRNGYGMETLNSPITATHESWYASRPEYVKRMMDRGQRYLYHVVDEVQKRGMPTEIALLPMVESAFNPTAYSTSKASGIWQFVPSTGKHFGLKQNWWADNRRDVMAATDAALTYLQKLHVMFGTWELALAAYNAGEGTVQRAIERNRKKGLPTDYQSLNLPAETKNYVPKLQAVKNIVTNPQQYGLDITPIPDKPYFTKVEAPAKIDASLAAKLAGVTPEEFAALNPAHNRPVLASASGKQEILLPLGKEDEFTANLAGYDKPLVSWQTYLPKPGERLDTISSRFGISVAQLKDVNDIRGKGRLKGNLPILVPAQGEERQNENLVVDEATPPTLAANDPAGSSTRYTVKRGESIHAIAKRHGVSVRQLMAHNGLKSSKLRNGQVLNIASNANPRVQKNTRLASSKSKSKIRFAKRGKNRNLAKRGENVSSVTTTMNVASIGPLRHDPLYDTSHPDSGHSLASLRETA